MNEIDKWEMDQGKRYGNELDQAALILQEIHPIGKVKAIGRLEVVQALKEVLEMVQSWKTKQ